ncbi:MAG: amidase [Pseudomonadales bacterium]|nr:amidase [Pseudomonadales bacterium]
MSDIPFLAASQLAKKIRDKEISSVELTQLYIDRIEKYDDAINAVVVRLFEQGLADAKNADALMARGHSLGPLHGVPMTMKESYNIADTPSTWGIEAFRDNVFTEDGVSAKRFRAIGAHFIGKTNVPVNLGDFQSYNPIYGTTGNPWDLERTPGGSSGGSAAALAAGLTGLEVGSDIGGSIRNPAHYCGVYGLKPTFGVIPWQGHDLLPNSPAPDLSVVGPLARSAEDIELAFTAMAGATGRASKGWQLHLPQTSLRNLQGLKVALWATDEQAPVTKETEDRVYQIGEVLKALGATVSADARPDFDIERANRNYLSLLSSVMGAGDNNEAFAKTTGHVAQLDPADNSRSATTMRGRVMSHRDWVRANNFRERLRFAWDEFFSEWDIVVCPQMATDAFPHDHRPFAERTIAVDGVDRDYMEQVFWAGLAINSYLPSTVFPSGLSAQGLPIGLQAIGAPFNDYLTIEFSRLLTQEVGGFEIPPNFA